MAGPPAPEPDWLARLNPAQRAAALATEGPLLVLAGAGTGKTSALTARLGVILARRLAFPSQILAVTFTNRAAREMRERLARMLGPGAEGMPWLGTFHATAARMLRRHADLVGLRPDFTVLDPDDVERLLKRVIAEAGLDERRWTARALAALIDRWKNRGLGPQDVPAEEARSFAEGRGAALYAAFQAELRRLNACDFGDLLLHLLLIFRARSDMLAEWQARFRYILVDEYQDSNAAQHAWLRLLAAPAHGGRGNICCVGDDDQSIYSWRGAEVGNILSFEADFPGARVIRLEQNYRSTQHILSAAGGLIARNGARLPKTLWTEAGAGERVRVTGVWDGPEEARIVGERIEQLLASGASADRIAILVRAQFQTCEFEDRFLAIGLPYRVVGGVRFYERAEIRDAIAYLRVIAQPDDALAFERILNKPRRGLGEKAVAALTAHARATGQTLPGAAQSLVETDELAPQARRGLAGLLAALRRWRSAAPGLPLPALLELVLTESGYLAMLEADRSSDAEGRLENLRELGRAIEPFADLSAFLEHVALVMDNDREGEAARVTLMTLHAAKGLEFDHVFLPGWEEGLFPSLRALEEGGQKALEEERRLAYVGLTRARRSATILHAANRRVHGQWTSPVASRFVAELPEAHVTVETTLSGGASLWRAAVFAPDAPFADAARATGRGPGWRRAAAHAGPAARTAVIDARPLARTVGAPGRSDLAVGQRVFHDKFGPGTILSREASKLQVAFDHAGTKMVLDSFVTAA